MLMISKRNYWLYSITGLFATVFIGSICHISIIPPRLTCWDLGILIPIILCGYISVRTGDNIGYRSRATISFLQSLILLEVYSNYWERDISFGNPVMVLSGLLIWIIGYTLMFTFITHEITMELSRKYRTIKPVCEKCGYILYGLHDPRCPECGTSFDPALLNVQPHNDERTCHNSR